jgi:hypothetical protein
MDAVEMEFFTLPKQPTKSTACEAEWTSEAVCEVCRTDPALAPTGNGTPIPLSD